MAVKDYYAILGLPKGASIEEVKKSYRELAKKHHPDKAKNKEEAERKFKEINEAYSILSNPQKKQMYDQYGFVGKGGFRESAGGTWGPFSFSFGGGRNSFIDLEFEDLFGKDIFDILFERVRGFESQMPLVLEKEISLTDALLGRQLDIKTPYGDFKLNIHPGTPSGATFVKNINGKNIHVTVKVRFPNKLTSEQKKLLEELRRKGL